MVGGLSSVAGVYSLRTMDSRSDWRGRVQFCSSRAQLFGNCVAALQPFRDNDDDQASIDP